MTRGLPLAGRAEIVNLSGGGDASPRRRFSAHAASKAAVGRFTETLAEEPREANVQVNVIGPGATRTRLIEQVLEAGARAGDRERSQAKEVFLSGGASAEKQVGLAVFLASDASSHVATHFMQVNDPWRELLAGPALSGDPFALRWVDPSNIGVQGEP